MKSALLLVGSVLALPRHRTEEEARPGDTIRRNLEKEWARLVESDFDEKLAQDFALHVPAQELPTEVFAALLGINPNLPSYFIEWDPHKGDRLDGAKIRVLLETPDLRFLDENGDLVEINDPTERAIRILTGYADIEPRGLARLLLNKYCALVVMALWTEEIFADLLLVQVAANASGFRPADIKGYCACPDSFRAADGQSISEVDLLVIDTIRRNPRRVRDILFQAA